VNKKNYRQKFYVVRIWIAMLFVSIVNWNCPGKQVKHGGAGNNDASQKPKIVADIKGCIKGRVVKEDDTGFAYVIVETQPVTSPKITDRNGYFDICYKSERSEDGNQASVKIALPTGQYTISVKKDGFHARPVQFDYEGKDINIGDIKMVERTRPLPEVVKKSDDKEEKRTSGVGGKAPIPE
jgi:hypothetical protein